MADDLDRILQSGAAEHAARMAPVPVDSVRARGDRLRRRRRGVSVAVAAAAVAGVGGGVFAALGPPQHGSPPSAVTIGTTPSSSPTGTGSAPPVPSAATSPGTDPASRAPGPGSSPSREPVARTSSSAPAHTSPPTASSCQSLVVSQNEKDAVTEAFRRNEPGLVHVAPVKGLFYYGECGGTFYAGAKFTPTSGASVGEQVQLQDDGSARKYFVRTAGGAWRYVASDGFPPDPRGCAAVHRIPAALSALWGGCLSH